MSLDYCMDGQSQNMYSYMHDNQRMLDVHTRTTNFQGLCHLNRALLYSQHVSTNAVKHAPSG